MSELNVQFGCGMKAPTTWTNFDASPTLWLSRLPLLRTVLKLPQWAANVQQGDVVKGLPLPDASCRRLFCDQVLEHLCREDVPKALRECRRLIAPDGVFRLFVPDLRKAIDHYMIPPRDGGAEAFMVTIGLGTQTRPRGFLAWVRNYLGNSAHLWAWDAFSMGKELREAGFTQVREVNYRDSGDELFQQLEHDVPWEFALGMEARP
jgi:SAM-dependent methyltransferase